MHNLSTYWYRLAPLHLLLFPLSLLFRVLVGLRRMAYRLRLLPAIKLPVPVIVVGNISVGGTGKTPLVLELVRQLIERGWHPGIVSRGYGGRARGPCEVSADELPDEVGDEPLLMARRSLCPVWIARDRPAAAMGLLQAHPECDIIVSDDGLQHYRLQRDMEIAVIDGERRFGNGLLLPAGPLREPLSRLSSVDAVVVNGGPVGPGEWTMHLTGVKFINLLNPELVRSAADFAGQTVHAIAGIGNPQRFFRHLHNLGLRCTTHAFPDHYRYTPADLAFADADAILMTEKDAVKCASFADERCWALRVDAAIDPAFFQLITKKVKP